MKNLFITLLLFNSACAQSITALNEDRFSRLFNQYDSSFEFLLVYFKSGSMLIENGRHFRIIGFTNGKGYLIDHYLSTNKTDSIHQQELMQSKSLRNFIEKNIGNIKSEEQILNPCTSRKTIRSNGDTTIIEITDLKLNEDYPNSVIEYKIKGKKRVVEQIEPALAMTICPDNIERKRFFDFIQYLNSYTNTPLKF